MGDGRGVCGSRCCCEVSVTEDKLICEKLDQIVLACYLLNPNAESGSVLGESQRLLTRVGDISTPY